MGAEGWNTIARNSDSSSFGPFSVSQADSLWLRGRGVQNAFLLAPSIQEAGGLENALYAFCKQWEAENGGRIQSSTELAI